MGRVRPCCWHRPGRRAVSFGSRPLHRHQPEVPTPGTVNGSVTVSFRAADRSRASDKTRDSHWRERGAGARPWVAMGWSPFAPGEFDDAAERRRDPCSGGRWLSQTTEWGTEQPTAADLWLLDGIYQFVAAETGCSRCGSPLGRRLRVDCWPTLLRTLRWRVLVRTRCRGRRRHAHVARVGQCSNGLVLSPFRLGHR